MAKSKKKQSKIIRFLQPLHANTPALLFVAVIAGVAGTYVAADSFASAHTRTYHIATENIVAGSPVNQTCIRNRLWFTYNIGNNIHSTHSKKVCGGSSASFKLPRNASHVFAGGESRGYHVSATRQDKTHYHITFWAK